MNEDCKQQESKGNGVLPCVSGSAIDFQDDLFKLINNYVDAGLSKPDLIRLMEYATESCGIS